MLLLRWTYIWWPSLHAKLDFIGQAIYTWACVLQGQILLCACWLTDNKWKGQVCFTNTQTKYSSSCVLLFCHNIIRNNSNHNERVNVENSNWQCLKTEFPNKLCKKHHYYSRKGAGDWGLWIDRFTVKSNLVLSVADITQLEGFAGELVIRTYTIT